mgnify:FL=1
MNNETIKMPIEQMYVHRRDFIVVALTGITGSGCSDLAGIMSNDFSDWKEVRKPGEVLDTTKEIGKQDVVFQRKYEACYNVCSKQYQPFEILRYRNVLLLSTLEKYASVNNYDGFLNHVSDLLKNKFDKSHKDVDEYYKVNNKFTNEELIVLGLDEDMFNSFKHLYDIHNNKERERFAYRKELCNIYFDDKFEDFCEKFYNELKRRDYFAKNFFVHRLANSIRATGNPDAIVNQDNEYNCDHIFDVIDLINGIIKGYHENYPQKPRRFVIDSVRSSLEIMYMRERFSGFYSVALHNDGNEKKLVEHKVIKSMFNKLEDELSEDQKSIYHATVNRIMALSNAESDKCDFEKGLFYSPDISRCVTESEIHLSYNSDDEDINSFKSLAEQWMKFYSLIVRPGLITPSSDERCMSIAYVAKFNSGCISRKVGCTIVDKEYTVQSIGWNDPPSTQLPCQMRYADELYSEDNDEAIKDVQDKIYSKYELTGNIKNTGKTFVSCIRDNVNKQTVRSLSNLGLRYSYCFRSQYNKFTGTKDQVNTRSLHAEENTMLRLAKSGGNGLKDGIMYVTASPCVLCSKKAFQIGIREIVYLDPYTDIAPDLILRCGWNTPKLKAFKGAIGVTFYKLYRPFMPYKDEIAILDRSFQKPLTDEQKNIQAEIQEYKNKIKELSKNLEILRRSE